MSFRVVVALVALPLFWMAGCAGDSSDPRTPAASHSVSEESAVTNEEYMHSAFAAHFTDPLYNDVSNDMTPFGSDEGADLLAEWDERRDELGADTTVAWMLDESEWGADAAAFAEDESYEDAMAVHSMGFILLRLTGQIDAVGKKLTLKALDFRIASDPTSAELRQQRRDLESWTG